LRFLKTLFWIVIAVLATYFAAQNWRDVTIDLWGNLQADVKIPVLLLIVFLIGFLPTWLMFRTRLWRITNRVSIAQRKEVPVQDNEAEPAE
jgi:putative membrane protein